MLQEPANSILISQNSLTPSLLKNGDIVFVRVVEDKGKGSYTVSFAGNRFSVRSVNPLKVGSSFKAQIFVENSILKLVPVFEPSYNQVSNQTVHSFLNRIGLPADDLSLRILQFFQQNQIKIDLRLAKKVRALSSAFPQREKEAAEVALLLSDKNIEATEEMIALFLDIMQGTTHANNTNSEILSYINHKKGSEKHWILIPFSDESSSVFTGIIKLLIHTETKKTEKIVINCATPVTKYYFVLQLYTVSNTSSKRVLTFCTVPSLSDAEQRIFTQQLRALFAHKGIEDMYYKQSLSEDGVFSENTELSYYQGSV